VENSGGQCKENWGEKNKIKKKQKRKRRKKKRRSKQRRKIIERGRIYK